jgi:hypothetical protein
MSSPEVQLPELANEAYQFFQTPEGRLLAVGILFAFSKKTRDIIKKRANGRSELSGIKGTLMHAMHLDHTRDEDYDDPDNGLYVTASEHLNFHKKHIGRASKIGLTESGNKWGISMLLEALSRHKDDLDRRK